MSLLLVQLTAVRLWEETEPSLLVYKIASPNTQLKLKTSRKTCCCRVMKAQDRYLSYQRPFHRALGKFLHFSNQREFNAHNFLVLTPVSYALLRSVEHWRVSVNRLINLLHANRKEPSEAVRTHPTGWRPVFRLRQMTQWRKHGKAVIHTPQCLHRELLIGSIDWWTTIYIGQSIGPER